jgi:hypothetical protein
LYYAGIAKTRHNSSATTRILRRVRAALADLDHYVSVTAVDRLDALYEMQHEITRRILEMEPPAAETDEQPATRWSPVRY